MLCVTLETVLILCVFLRRRSLVVDVKGQSVTCDLYHVVSKVEVAKHGPHGGSVRVHVVMRSWIVLLEVQDEGHELTEPPLVEHPHQIWRKNNVVPQIHLWLQHSGCRTTLECKQRGVFVE